MSGHAMRASLLQGLPPQGLVSREKRADGRSGGEGSGLELEMHDKRGPLLAGLACAAPALGGTVNRRANPGRDLDIAKIAAVRAAWIRAVEASDIGGLTALSTDHIVGVHGNGKAAIGVCAFTPDLEHDFGIFDV